MARDLPLIDEHNMRIEADIRSVWSALLEGLEDSRDRPLRSWGASVLGCSVTSSNHLSLGEVGATTPGFTVTEAIPLTRLAVRGRHRFSEYALEFELELVSSTTTSIRARTRAAFPGLRGGVYRHLVLGSGAHVAAVTATLRAIKRRAEADAMGQAGALA